MGKYDETVDETPDDIMEPEAIEPEPEPEPEPEVAPTPAPESGERVDSTGRVKYPWEV